MIGDYLFLIFLNLGRYQVTGVLLLAERAQNQDQSKLSKEIGNVTSEPPSNCGFSILYLLRVANGRIRRRHICAIQSVILSRVLVELEVPETNRADLEEKCDRVDDEHPHVHPLG